MMTAWYLERPFREQALIVMAAVVTALTVVWFALVWPAVSANGAAHDRYQASARALDRVTMGISQITASQVSGPMEVAAGQLSSDEVRARVVGAAQSLGLSPAQLRNGQGGAISANFRNTDSRMLFALVQLLSTRDGVVVRQAAFSRGDDGRVSAEFEFVGGGS